MEKTLAELWQEASISNARAEIADLLEQDGISATDEQLDAMAKQAVDNYDNDNIRAECWNHAIGEAIDDSPISMRA
jgi:hypothetical protein